MSEPSSEVSPRDFQIEWHADVVVVTPAANMESLNWDVIEQTTQLVLKPLRELPAPPIVLFDLQHVRYFGSVFLALLLRCHKLAKSRGGELVLCGVGGKARDLLRITALDTLWAIYESRSEALSALSA